MPLDSTMRSGFGVNFQGFTTQSLGLLPMDSKATEAVNPNALQGGLASIVGFGGLRLGCRGVRP